MEHNQQNVGIIQLITPKSNNGKFIFALITQNITTSIERAILDDLRKELLASENNFRQLFNSSHVPQWMYDIETLRFIFVNEAAIESYGYSEAEFLNMTIMGIIPPEETQKLTLYNEFMRATSKPFFVVSPYLKKNGDQVLAETTYNNLRYNDRRYILVTSVDISGRLEQQEKISLRKATRHQKITLATINGQEKERHEIGKELHENIGQLLSAAMLHLEFARTDERSRVDLIYRAEKIIANAINDIKSLSDTLAPPSLRDIGFKSSLQTLFEPYLSAKAFSITLSFEEKMNNVDEEIQVSLYRIIQEHLENTLKHARAKSITIDLRITDQVYLLIKDDGDGSDAAITTNGQGITNMKDRVALYNGTIKIQSRPQEGSKLLISIPIKKTTKREAMMTALIVENDPDDQQIIMRAFTEVAPHYKVVCLDDGKVLIDLLKSTSQKELPALIVLDYNMPLLNGLEILKLLELDDRYNNIPKIIYSSSSLNHIKNLCYSANAKAYITKGITMDQIRENIQEMLAFV